MGSNNKKKQNKKKEFTLSKGAVIGISIGFVVVSVLIGVVMSKMMDDGLSPPSVLGEHDKSNQKKKNFEKAKSGMPGLDDPVFEIKSTMAPDPMNGTKIRDICAGGHFTAALDAQNHKKMWLWGLMANNARILENPGGAEFSEDIIEIACGSFQLLVRTESGRVFTMGNSPEQMCGDQDIVNDKDDLETSQEVLKPKVFEGLEEAGPIVQISAGFKSNAFLTADGKLYFQGMKAHGPFPSSDPDDCLVNATLAPMPPGMKRIRAVSLGSRFTGVIAESEDENGKTCSHVFFAGINAYGAMGVAAPNATGEWIEAKLPEKLYGCEAGNEVVEISCGGDHALLRTQDGTVLGSGWNEKGQLGTHDKQDRHEFEPLAMGTGLPEKATSVVQIHAGPYGSSFVRWNDGTLTCTGSVDSSSQGNDRFTVVELPDSASAVGVKKVSSGFMHAVVLLNDDTVRTFGNAMFGHVGIPIRTDDFLQRWSKG